MSKTEKLAAVMLMAGFASLVVGIAAFTLPGAFIVGGCLLMIFGTVIDRAAT